jgi:formate hydrogenlyase subunit 3/multisubunit Na+/H+ antiporter MnhD subunit
MPQLTKKESVYFIITAIASVALLITTLVLWSQTQETCWSKYQTETTAVRECEG